MPGKRRGGKPVPRALPIVDNSIAVVKLHDGSPSGGGLPRTTSSGRGAGGRVPSITSGGSHPGPGQSPLGFPACPPTPLPHIVEPSREEAAGALAALSENVPCGKCGGQGLASDGETDCGECLGSGQQQISTQKHLSSLQTVSWVRKDEDEPSWAALPADDERAIALEEAWGLTLELGGEPGATVCRRCGHPCSSNPFCAQTGQRHVDPPADFAYFRRAVRLHSCARDAIADAGEGVLVSILRHRRADPAAVSFAAMCILKLTKDRRGSVALREGGVSATAATLMEHLTREATVQHCAAALGALVSGPGVLAARQCKAPPLQELKEAEKALSAALVRYPHNMEMVQYCCIGLLALTWQDMGLYKELLDEARRTGNLDLQEALRLSEGGQLGVPPRVRCCVPGTAAAAGPEGSPPRPGPAESGAEQDWGAVEGARLAADCYVTIRFDSGVVKNISERFWANHAWPEWETFEEGGPTREGLVGQIVAACVRALTFGCPRLPRAAVVKLMFGLSRGPFRSQVIAALGPDGVSEGCPAGWDVLRDVADRHCEEDYSCMLQLLNLRPGAVTGIGQAARSTLVDSTTLTIAADGDTRIESLKDLFKANRPRFMLSEPPTPPHGCGHYQPDTAVSPVSSAFANDCWMDPWNEVWRQAILDAEGKLEPLHTPETLRKMQDDAHRVLAVADGVSDEVADRARALLFYLDRQFHPQQGFDRQAEGFARRMHQDLECFSNEVIRLQSRRPKLVDLKAPCYVFGDIHGNYGDLTDLCNKLCVLGDLRYTPYTLLFLGDYVDRGKWGPECVAYLFALKVLAPHDVVLLRGNHEDPDINSIPQYGAASYEWQCKKLWGQQLGQRLYDLSNRAFATMPVAAVIENKVFCCHGGIPRYSGGPDDRLNVLRSPVFPDFPLLKLPEGYDMQSALERILGPVPVLPTEDSENRMQIYAYDLAWADPSESEEALDEYGFGQSVRGMTVASYGQRAVLQFLENHGLDLIIRGHETRDQGLQVAKQARVVTVFTSADYCGNGSPGGVVLVRRTPCGDLICRMILRHRPSGQACCY